MIINRYLIREVAGPVIGVAAVLVVVFITYSLTVFLADASSGLLSPGQVAVLTLLKGVIALEVLLPIALYVGIILGLGRLHTDAEMDALRAAGVGELQILVPMLRLALSLALLVALLSALVRPLAYHSLLSLRAEAEAASEIDRIKGGRFYTYTDSGRAVFIQSTRDGTDKLGGIFIRTRNEEGLQVISAHQGRFVTKADASHHDLLLQDANVYKRTSDGRDVFGKFSAFSIKLPIKQPEPVGRRPKVLSLLELANSERPADRAEFQWRLSTPVSTLLLALLAVPLSRSRPRQGRFARMLVALVVYAVYFNTVSITRTWVEQGQIDNIVPVPALLGLVVLGLYLPWRRWWAQLRGGNHASA